MSKQSIARYQRLNGRRALPSRSRSHQGGGHWGRWIAIVLVLALLLLAAGGSYVYYGAAGRPERDTTYLLVAPGSDYASLRPQLQKKLWLRYPQLFDRLASWRGLADKPLRAGRYAITQSMTMSEVIDELQQGPSVPLRLTPGALRTDQEVIDFLTAHLYLKADSLKTQLLHDSRYSSLGAQPLMATVLRQPYTLPWDISAPALLDSLWAKKNAFWQGTRTSQAEQLGLTPLAVTTLASIVESESSKTDEYPRIAGLYLNRLRKNMRLQSDPTVKYAVGDFSLKRITGEHLAVVSPYNTYKVTGLPPAPIVLPQQATIEAVLKAEEHQYLYMCAKEDFSGYHNFAQLFAQHLANAKRYQEALNKRNIH